ncbi:MAG: 3-dehydroquinate synthase [Myxococcota bacterium]
MTGEKPPGKRQGRELERVYVELDERSYAVEIGAGTLDDLGARVAVCTGAKRAVILTVPPVGRRYVGRAKRSLASAGIRATRIEVPDGDRSKNLRQVEKLYHALLEEKVDRKTVLVALGGGMVGDLTGFVAATFLRGIPFVQVPTTVLAMVDSSIGGKTGVNLSEGKNLVGAFHQPKLVAVDIETLRSLPDRERAAGFAEVVKKAAIWDAEFFAALERDAEALMDLEEKALVRAISRAVEIKAEVVRRDEREQGVRMLLNFGHTLGHAIEALKRYRGLLHGEAVAIGMVYAAERSEALDLSPAGTRERIEALLSRLGLPTEPPAFDRKAYLDALGVDKKKQDSRIQYVVLEGIGSAKTVPLTPSEIAAGLPRTVRGRGKKAVRTRAGR